MGKKRKRKGKAKAKGKKKKGPSKGASRPVIDPNRIPEGRRKVLEAFPIRNPSKDLKWTKKDGLVVIRIKKMFSRFERRLHKVVGGPEWLRIPLDGPGSRIWELCDGEHTVMDIAFDVHSKFKEEVEPVLKRVLKFLELLLKRNLILLKPGSEVKKEVKKKKKKIKGPRRAKKTRKKKD
jgi:hypothetical protein